VLVEGEVGGFDSESLWKFVARIENFWSAKRLDSMQRHKPGTYHLDFCDIVRSSKERCLGCNLEEGARDASISIVKVRWNFKRVFAQEQPCT
jgi:hypothetical protein